MAMNLHKKCRSVHKRGMNIRINKVQTNYEAKGQPVFFFFLKLILVGLCIDHETKMVCYAT